MSDVIDFKTLVEQTTLDPISEWRDKSACGRTRNKSRLKLGIKSVPLIA